jgi:heme oxygenase
MTGQGFKYYFFFNTNFRVGAREAWSMAKNIAFTKMLQLFKGTFTRNKFMRLSIVKVLTKMRQLILIFKYGP